MEADCLSTESLGVFFKLCSIASILPSFLCLAWGFFLRWALNCNAALCHGPTTVSTNASGVLTGVRVRRRDQCVCLDKIAPALTLVLPGLLSFLLSVCYNTHEGLCLCSTTTTLLSLLSAPSLSLVLTRSNCTLLRSFQYHTPFSSLS